MGRVSIWTSWIYFANGYVYIASRHVTLPEVCSSVEAFTSGCRTFAAKTFESWRILIVGGFDCHCFCKLT